MPRTGRPSKFTKENKAKAEKLSRRGFTDAEVCEILNINQSTFTRWKQKHKDFCITLKDWKESSDENVKRSLYERACGYSHPEDKIFCNNGEIIIQVTRKHYPPDPTSAIFWLKNRQPEKWRDKTDVNHSGTVRTTVSLGEDDRKIVHEFLEAFKSAAIKESI